jgi:hypothetical protein
MKKILLAALAALTLGAGAASAATPNTQTHKPNYYNWLAGGD